METSLTGTYPMTVDSKIRVTLPSIMRKSVGKTVTLLPFNGCVYGFAPEDFEDFVQKSLNTADHAFDPRSRADARLERGLRGSAVTVELDSAGRIALGKLDIAKPGRCEALGVTGDVAVVGNGSRFEIWNAEKLAAEQESFEEDLEALYFHD